MKKDTVKSLKQIHEALVTLDITGDNLFASIRADLDRGLIASARGRLDFVDFMTKDERTHVPGKESNEQGA